MLKFHTTHAETSGYCSYLSQLPVEYFFQAGVLFHKKHENMHVHKIINKCPHNIILRASCTELEGEQLWFSFKNDFVGPWHCLQHLPKMFKICQKYVQKNAAKSESSQFLTNYGILKDSLAPKLTLSNPLMSFNFYRRLQLNKIFLFNVLLILHIPQNILTPPVHIRIKFS